MLRLFFLLLLWLSVATIVALALGRAADKKNQEPKPPNGAGA